MNALKKTWKSSWLGKILVVCIPVIVFGIWAMYTIYSFYSRMPTSSPASYQTIQYVPISLSDLDVEYDQTLMERVYQLRDSLELEINWTGEDSIWADLPDGYENVEVRMCYQPSNGNPLDGQVFIYADFRLRCDCDPELGNFWLLRFKLNPLDYSTTLIFNDIVPWLKYVPKNRLIVEDNVMKETAQG